MTYQGLARLLTSQAQRVAILPFYISLSPQSLRFLLNMYPVTGKALESIKHLPPPHLWGFTKSCQQLFTVGLQRKKEPFIQPDVQESQGLASSNPFACCSTSVSPQPLIQSQKGAFCLQNPGARPAPFQAQLWITFTAFHLIFRPSISRGVSATNPSKPTCLTLPGYPRPVPVVILIPSLQCPQLLALQQLDHQIVK